MVITVFSADQENDPDILGIIGASAALSISEMPFEGPIGATRVGHIDGDFVINPTFAQRARSALDLVVVSTADAIMMLEAGATEIPEGLAKEAIRRGHEVNQEIVRMQHEMVDAVGKPTMTFASSTTPTPEMIEEVARVVGGPLGLRHLHESGEGGAERSAGRAHGGGPATLRRGPQSPLPSATPSTSSPRSV